MRLNTPFMYLCVSAGVCYVNAKESNAATCQQPECMHCMHACETTEHRKDKSVKTSLTSHSDDIKTTIKPHPSPFGRNLSEEVMPAGLKASLCVSRRSEEIQKNPKTSATYKHNDHNTCSDGYDPHSIPKWETREGRKK